jgi:hypothetical protein
VFHIPQASFTLSTSSSSTDVALDLMQQQQHSCGTLVAQQQQQQQQQFEQLLAMCTMRHRRHASTGVSMTNALQGCCFCSSTYSRLPASIAEQPK